jgi:hypothetical protein
MRKFVFRRLVKFLSEKVGLGDSRYVTLEEQVAIFLYTVVTNLSNWKVAERFQRSGDTISKYVLGLFSCIYGLMIFGTRYFNRILNALTSKAFYGTFVKLPDEHSPTPMEISQNPKLYPFLKDTKGAFDGSHIDANPPTLDRARYRNRKGGLSINVLAGCDSKAMFIYVLSGWEGSAADGTIFANALQKDLKIPEGKYYLADAGFGACDSLLVPYRGVRYHLREWSVAKDRYGYSCITDSSLTLLQACQCQRTF